MPPIETCSSTEATYRPHDEQASPGALIRFVVSGSQSMQPGALPMRGTSLRLTPSRLLDMRPILTTRDPADG